MRNDIMERKAEVEKWISENKPKAFICRQLGCRPSTLDGYLVKWGIDYKGNMGGRGKSSPKKKSALEYLENPNLIVSKLRHKLIEYGLKDDRCELCKYEIWMGKKIPLELHHKD